MTSTEKLVERLREAVVDEPNYGKALRLSLTPEDVEQAADALEAKDARIAELEAALEPFVRADRALGREPGPYRFETGNGHVNLDREDFRRAASARGREPEGGK